MTVLNVLAKPEGSFRSLSSWQKFMRCLNYVGTFYYTLTSFSFSLQIQCKTYFSCAASCFSHFFYFLYYIIFIYYFLIMEKTNLNLFFNIWKKWQNMTNRDRLLCLRKDLKSKFFFFHKLFVSSFSVLRDQNVEIRNLMFLFMMPFHL